MSGPLTPFLRQRRLLPALIVALACTAGPALAVDQPEDQTASIQVDQQRSRAEYETLSRDMQLSVERLAGLAAEIATLKKDHATVTAALIQSAKTEKKLAVDIEDIEARLAVQRGQEATLKESLRGRSGLLAEVIGALQRMGLNPPPAILVRPEDALSSVRSAILLGSVVPELKAETTALVADLEKLNRISAAIEDERNRLSGAIADQMAEKRRLEMLLVEKARLQGETQGALVAERQRSEELAKRAKSLKELIAALDVEAEARRKAAEAAALEAARQQQRDAELAALPVPEKNRLAGPAPFSRLQGQLALPVSGRIDRAFGSKDGNGGVMQGDMVATQSAAIVTAPSDGNVLYAGQFRSYGQLLILDAGDGYHIVLAGLDRINVSEGQSVLAGEPVGAMGETRLASVAAVTSRNAGPELYVEFRKDGKPIDPAPWWARRISGRT